MRKLLMLAPVMLFLPAGMCTTPQPGIEVRTVEVPVETQRPCPGIVPERPAPMERPLPTDSVALIARLAAKLMEYTAPGMYADQVDAYVAVCPPAP